MLSCTNCYLAQLMLKKLVQPKEPATPKKRACKIFKSLEKSKMVTKDCNFAKTDMI